MPKGSGRVPVDTEIVTINELEVRAVKLVGDDVVEGLGMPFGGPFNGRDLDGERFTEKTDFAFDWFAERPLLYQHGLDDGTGISVVGRVKSWELRADLGVWVQAQLDKSHEYFDAVKELVKKGKLFFSSGAMRHLVEVNAKTGEIRRWPWVELSLTPTPSNMMAQVEMAAAKSHFEMAGLKMGMSDELRAVWTAAYINDLEDRCFAFIESGGEKDDEGKTKPRSLRHFPYRDADGELDEAHIRNALGRIPQSTLPQDAKDRALRIIRRAAEQVGIEVAEEKTADVKALSGSYEELIEKLQALINPPNPFEPMGRWAYIVATFPDYVIVCQHDAGEERTWRVEYAVGAEGKVTLGAIIEVEETYIPAPPESPLPIALQAETIAKSAVALAKRTKDLSERRLKEGRILSGANKKRLAACMEAMSAAVDELRGLLSDAEPEAKAEDLLRQGQQLEILRLYEATIPRNGG